ncbi:MAG: TIGR03905 family TSCPD domain-containing protein [Proteocatella sp.]
MEKIVFTPSALVCSKEIQFSIKNDVILDCKISGGCPGNLIGISKIMVGKNPQEVIEAFKGVTCGKRGTSCPNEISVALEQYLKKKQA